jgi:lactoylglutathione lyase
VRPEQFNLVERMGADSSPIMGYMNDVRELRLVLTVDDYDAALGFYRDMLGLSELAAYDAPNGGRVTLLEAGRATVELADAAQASYIDDVEVGRRVAGSIRVAFEVSDAEGMAARLAAAGAETIAGPTRTPWNSLNSRLVTPEGLQLTVFQELQQD